MSAERKRAPTRNLASASFGFSGIPVRLLELLTVADDQLARMTVDHTPKGGKHDGRRAIQLGLKGVRSFANGNDILRYASDTYNLPMAAAYNLPVCLS